MWRTRHNVFRWPRFTVPDLENQSGNHTIEMHPARAAPPVTASMLREPEHGDFQLPEHPETSEANTKNVSKDPLIRLVGPNVGDLTDTSAYDEHVVMTNTLEHWIDGAARQESLSYYQLYVNLHCDCTTLYEHDPSQSPSLNIDFAPDVKSMLALDVPTHTLSISCDCVAPQARIDLFLHASSRRVGTNVCKPPTLTTHSHGWRLASCFIHTGYDVVIRFPLSLDDAWDLTTPMQMTVSVEALDEDGLSLLPGRNAITTVWEVRQTGSSWHAASIAQYACLNSMRLQMHEIFGLAPLSTEQVAPRPSNTAGGGNSYQKPPVVNATRLHNATMLADAEREDSAECPICMSNPAMTILFPCTHALCLECAVHLRDSVQKSRQQDRRHGRAPRRQYVCHICRSEIESMLALSKQPLQAHSPKSPLPQDVSPTT